MFNITLNFDILILIAILSTLHFTEEIRNLSSFLLLNIAINNKIYSAVYAYTIYMVYIDNNKNDIRKKTIKPIEGNDYATIKHCPNIG